MFLHKTFCAQKLSAQLKMHQSANSQMQVLLQFRAVDKHFVCAKEGCRDTTPMLQFIAVFETLAVRARGQEWCKWWLVAPITGGGIGCPKVLLQPPHAWQLRYAEGDSNAATEFFGFHDLWAEGRGLNVADLPQPTEADCTSSTAQGGGGSFKNRKPIGLVGCCESRMAERIHWWTERWLELCFLEWLQWLQWSPGRSPHPQMLDVVM